MIWGKHRREAVLFVFLSFHASGGILSFLGERKYPKNAI